MSPSATRGLPTLPTIVERVFDSLPGDGFFVMAFLGVTEEQARLRLWRDEVARVRQAAYPGA